MYHHIIHVVHRHPASIRLVIITSPHHPCILYPCNCSLFLCARRCRLYEYKNEVELDGSIPQEAPPCTHFLVYDYGPRRFRCIRRSTAFWHWLSFHANTFRDRSHISYHMHSAFPSCAPLPGSYCATNQVASLFSTQLSHRLRSILFFKFIVHPLSTTTCILILLRIVSYRPFSHLRPYTLVNVAASNQPQSLS